MLRQGDVLLIPETIPGIAKAVPYKGDVILALGEVTGHAHRIATPGVEVYEHEGTRWIRVPTSGAALTHEEHGAIALAPIEYRVRLQREYRPGALPQNVRD